MLMPGVIKMKKFMEFLETFSIMVISSAAILLVVVLMMLVSKQACAGPYLELGIGYNASYYGQGCITDLLTGCSQNPLGIVSAGYKFNDIPIVFQFDHMSSLQDKDVGLNVLSIRYRFE